MDQDELFRRLGVALAIGLLIGLERGWRAREDAEGERTAGLRTYALTGLLGGTAGALSKTAKSAYVGGRKVGLIVGGSARSRSWRWRQRTPSPL
jgi:uncharacterized membrane protein YhiD involved in acid resistance